MVGSGWSGQEREGGTGGPSWLKQAVHCEHRECPVSNIPLTLQCIVHVLFLYEGGGGEGVDAYSTTMNCTYMVKVTSYIAKGGGGGGRIFHYRNHLSLNPSKPNPLSA